MSDVNHRNCLQRKLILLVLYAFDRPTVYLKHLLRPQIAYRMWKGSKIARLVPNKSGKKSLIKVNFSMLHKPRRKNAKFSNHPCEYY